MNQSDNVRSTKKATDAEIEAWLSAHERVPLTDDEIASLRWSEEHFGDTLNEPPDQSVP